MLSEWARNWTREIRAAIARVLGRWGVAPNVLTAVGYLLHLPAVYVIAQGHLRLGGALFAVASLFDSLDGAVAREMDQGSVFGAFLDSVTDRFSEATVYFGLFLWYLRSGGDLELALIYIALVGSLMVSYTRARAEGLGVPCQEGLFTRFERVLLLVVALIMQQVRLALWAMAILTMVTALQRVYHVYRATREKNAAKGS